MGARGATASSEAADVVLTVDRLDRLGEARQIARRSSRIALESVVAGMAMSLLAMGFAAFGLLPAVWGAVLQEGIDVIVILNALRALHGNAKDVSLAQDDAVLTKRFQAEHQAIRADIDRVRAAADSLGTIGPNRRWDKSSRFTGSWSTRSCRTRGQSKTCSTRRSTALSAVMTQPGLCPGRMWRSLIRSGVWDSSLRTLALVALTTMTWQTCAACCTACMQS